MRTGNRVPSQSNQRPAFLGGGSPGAARPMKSQGSGTAYGMPQQQPARTLPPGRRPAGRYAYGADRSAMPYTDTMQPRPQFGAGNFAYAQPDKRPPPFQQSMDFMGAPVDPGQYYGQRDAFIQQVGNQLGQMQAQSWQSPGMGPPQFNFPQMWGQAGDMVQQGWQNPLMGLL